jgi:hypothetical protein
MKLRRQRLISIGILAGAVVVVLLVALIGLGYLVLPQSSPAPITIASTEYTILEGTKASGGYWFWFANSSGNYTDGNCANFQCSVSYPGVNGYPTTIAPGSTFYLPWVLWNKDTVAHNVTSVVIGPPFSLVKTVPPVPVSVPAGYDDANFEFWLTAPSEAGASLAITITIQTT